MLNRKWEELEASEFAEARMTRNGKLQVMTSFLAILPMPAIILDARSRIIYMNQRAEQNWQIKLQKSQGQILGKAIGLSDSDWQQARSEDRQALALREATVSYDSYRSGKEREFVLRVPIVLDGDMVLSVIYVPLEALKDQQPE